MSLKENFLRLWPFARCKAQTRHTVSLGMRFATLAYGSRDGNFPNATTPPLFVKEGSQKAVAKAALVAAWSDTAKRKESS